MPTDYSKALIYCLLCEDGRFYIGSTVLALNVRFGQHKRAVDKGVNSKVYRHVRGLGGPDKMRIELVAADLGVKTRDELLKVEDTYIRQGLKDKRCLNRNKPRATSEERQARDEAQVTMWRRINRDIAAGKGGHDMTMGDRVREYYRTHRRITKPKRSKANAEQLISCECGWDIMRGRIAGHRKTKEHKAELMYWFFMKKVLQRAGTIPPDRVLPEWLTTFGGTS